MIERREGGHGTPVCFPDEELERGRNVRRGAVADLGSRGVLQARDALFGFFFWARSVGFWWVGGVYCWGFWGEGGGWRAKRGV